ncbi:hypothetical protein MAR_007096, partial [Mya arenaria]
MPVSRNTWTGRKYTGGHRGERSNKEQQMTQRKTRNLEMRSSRGMTNFILIKWTCKLLTY